VSVELWACEAYGSDGLQFGALCFFGLPNQRKCRTLEWCEFNMANERVALWDRLTRLARQGDDLAIEVLKDIAGPEDLLSGPRLGSR